MVKSSRFAVQLGYYGVRNSMVLSIKVLIPSSSPRRRGLNRHSILRSGTETTAKYIYILHILSCNHILETPHIILALPLPCLAFLLGHLVSPCWTAGNFSIGNNAPFLFRPSQEAADASPLAIGIYRSRGACLSCRKQSGRQIPVGWCRFWPVLFRFAVGCFVVSLPALGGQQVPELRLFWLLFAAKSLS